MSAESSKATKRAHSPSETESKRSKMSEGSNGAKAISESKVQADESQATAAETAQKEDAPKKTSAPAKKVKRDLSFKEDPFSYVDPDHKELQSIVYVYLCTDDLPLILTF